MTTPPAHLVRWSASRRTIATLAVMAIVTACTGTDASVVSGPQPGAARRVVAQTASGQLFMRYGGMCTLDVSGVALCWGRNDEGQIGDASTTDRPAPTPVGGGLTFSNLALSDKGTCGLATAGAVYCWGFDKERFPGQVDYRLLPKAVTGNDVYAIMSSSDQNACGVTTLGDTKCWGLWYTDTFTPQTLAGVPTFVSLTAGTLHWCGLDAAKLATCWGYNASGQVGNGTSGQQYVPPAAIASGRKFNSLNAGFTHTCGADLGGTAYCWGNDNAGQVGNGATSLVVDTPTRVVTNLRFVKVTGGNSTSCGITSAGAAWCWGNGYQGQLGNGGPGLALTPVAVQGGLVFRDIVMAGLNACGLTYHGQVYFWGDNASGQLLDGTTNTAWTPKLMPFTL